VLWHNSSEVVAQSVNIHFIDESNAMIANIKLTARTLVLVAYLGERCNM
jgi:hypothetical protein